MRRTALFSLSLVVVGCESTAPSTPPPPPPKDHVRISARLLSPNGSPMLGAFAVIKTWPAQTGHTDDTFTGFLFPDAEGRVVRDVGPLAESTLDSVRIYAMPAAACTWNPVETLISAIRIDTVPESGVHVDLVLPETLTRAVTVVAEFCAQGREIPDTPGHLGYDVRLRIDSLKSTLIYGRWWLGLEWRSVTGVLTGSVAGNTIVFLLVPNALETICQEIRLVGTVLPNAHWDRLSVIADDGCIPAGHQYMFFRTGNSSFFP